MSFFPGCVRKYQLTFQPWLATSFPILKYSFICAIFTIYHAGFMAYKKSRYRTGLECFYIVDQLLCCLCFFRKEPMLRGCRRLPLVSQLLSSLRVHCDVPCGPFMGRLAFVHAGFMLNTPLSEFFPWRRLHRINRRLTPRSSVSDTAPPFE